MLCLLFVKQQCWYIQSLQVHLPSLALNLPKANNTARSVKMTVSEMITSLSNEGVWSKLPKVPSGETPAGSVHRSTPGNKEARPEVIVGPRSEIFNAAQKNKRIRTIQAELYRSKAGYALKAPILRPFIYRASCQSLSEKIKCYWGAEQSRSSWQK